MIRYQYDDFGWYIGPVETDEVLPKTTSFPPPDFVPDDKRPNYVGNGWTLLDYTEIIPTGIVSVIDNSPTKYLIDTGSFTDRFSDYGIIIDLIDDVIVQSFLKNLNRRKWVDLTDQKVIMFVYYLAGTEVSVNGTTVSMATPILTQEQAIGILTNPVLPEENSALRKSFFS